jgi:N-acetylmuramoyl-L-alanine amidase
VFFISLHFDSAWPHSIHGGAVYFDPRSGCLPALASLISEELGRDATQRHASYRGRQGLSTGEMGVLDPAHNPVPEKILFEVGTITNDSDRKQAFDPFWRRAMARLIARAVVQVHQGD